MRKNLFGRGIFIFLLFIFAVILTGCFNSSSGSKIKPVNQEKNDQVENKPAVDLEKEYEAMVVEVLKPYFEKERIDNIKDQLLELKVPPKYLDLHFDLVIAFEQIEQGQKASDQEKIEAGLEQIKKIKNQYPWLIE